MSQTYLTTEELAELIKYGSRTIPERLKDSMLLEGRHYFRPFGGRKILYIWEAIEAEITLGQFDYAQYFPESPRVQEFREIKCWNNNV